LVEQAVEPLAAGAVLAQALAFGGVEALQDLVPADTRPDGGALGGHSVGQLLVTQAFEGGVGAGARGLLPFLHQFSSPRLCVCVI
jgi:hypothetical protein